jgi:hypothetical protein
VAALTMQEDQRAISEGAAGIAKRGAGAAEAYGARAVAAEVEPARLREMLTYPREWGPSEWGELWVLTNAARQGAHVVDLGQDIHIKDAGSNDALPPPSQVPSRSSPKTTSW